MICLNPSALHDIRTIRDTNQANAQNLGIPAKLMAKQMRQSSLLSKSPITRDIGTLAAFLLSDGGAILNSHIIDADFGVANVI